MKIGKKNKKYKENNGVYGNAADYRVYHMKAVDILIGFCMGALVAATIFYMFFRTFEVVLVTALIGGIIGIIVNKRKQLKKRQEELISGFKEMLESLATSFGSGKNANEAFQEAIMDLSCTYPKGSDILNELKLIVDGMNNNRTMEQMMRDFGERSGLEDVMNFTDVFVETSRQGGDMSQIINDVRNVINEKIDTEREIKELMSQGANDFRIMLPMPILILFLTNTDSSMSIVPNTDTNIEIKILVLSIFGLSYLISIWLSKKKI
ncbi:MAG: kinase [Eubacterium sp.]|nr:kinase [Eubacterium sp.]